MLHDVMQSDDVTVDRQLHGNAFLEMNWGGGLSFDEFEPKTTEKPLLASNDFEGWIPECRHAL